jgi:hypothetical protein
MVSIGVRQLINEIARSQRIFPLLQPKVVTSNAMNTDPDLDVSASLAIFYECERAFRSAKKLITPERKFLGDNIIEALECLRAWWNNGLIKEL